MARMSTPKTALIVDNSRFVRCVLKELLSDLGLQTVAEAADAQEAIKAYRSHRPDLVTLDIHMPGAGSGIEALKDIRLQNPNAKVVIVTDSQDEAVHREALACGAATILRKPLSATDFKAALDQMGRGIAAATESAAPAKRRALVIDDSAVMRALVRALLTEQDFDVVGEAGDVQEGIDAYERLHPDLVTLDMVMPGGSGADVLKKIRAQSATTQVVMLTSVIQEKVTAELLKSGAGAVLAKPLTAEKLKAALEPTRTPPPGAAPAAPAGPARRGADALKEILANGAARGVGALNEIFNVSWTSSETSLLQGAPTAGALDGLFDGAADSVAVRMTVQGEMPAVCLFLVNREGAEKIAALLAPGSASDGDVNLVAMEWANILMTNILNAFADARGGSILSSPPEFDEAPPAELIVEAVRKLGADPLRAFATRNRFASPSLGVACDAVFILAEESVGRLATTAAA